MRRGRGPVQVHVAVAACPRLGLREGHREQGPPGAVSRLVVRGPTPVAGAEPVVTERTEDNNVFHAAQADAACPKGDFPPLSSRDARYLAPVAVGGRDGHPAVITAHQPQALPGVPPLLCVVTG